MEIMATWRLQTEHSEQLLVKTLDIKRPSEQSTAQTHSKSSLSS